MALVRISAGHLRTLQTTLEKDGVGAKTRLSIHRLLEGYWFGAKSVWVKA